MFYHKQHCNVCYFCNRFIISLRSEEYLKIKCIFKTNWPRLIFLTPLISLGKSYEQNARDGIPYLKTLLNNVLNVLLAVFFFSNNLLNTHAQRKHGIKFKFLYELKIVWDQIIWCTMTNKQWPSTNCSYLLKSAGAISNKTVILFLYLLICRLLKFLKKMQHQLNLLLKYH